MENRQKPRPRDVYVAPMGVELGSLVDVTAGKNGASSDGYGGCEFPSSTR
jgi:hypothetical protein